MVKITVKQSGSARSFARRLAEQTRPVPCPNPKCGRPIDVKIADMKPGGGITCPKCQARIDFTGDNIAAKAEKALRDLTRTIDRMGR